jgi:hypothetical protein
MKNVILINLAYNRYNEVRYSTLGERERSRSGVGSFSNVSSIFWLPIMKDHVANIEIR